ncbi:MAG TPA: hypothetical protein VI756_10175 [Blastocatellia bacterium]
MKLIVEYLEHAFHFEQMASEAEDEKFKASLLEQAVAYRKLAEKRAKQMELPLPMRPKRES